MMRRPAVDLRRIVALFLLGVVTSSLLYFEIGRLERRSAHYEFERYAGNLNLAAQLQERIDLSFGPLRHMAAPAGGVSSDELCREGVAADAPLLSCGMAEEVTQKSRTGFETERGVTITEKGGNEELRTASSRERYFPIASYHERANRRSALGFDLFSPQPIRAAIESARAENRLVALPLHRFIDDTRNHSLLLLVAPVAGGERARVVFGLFNINLLVQAALGVLPPEGIAFYLEDVTDGTGGETGERLYASHNIRSAKVERKILFTERVFLAGRSWRIRALPSGDFIAANSGGRAFFALLSGLLVTFLATGYLFFLSRQSRIVERLVEERMEELTHANRLKALGEMAAQVAHELNQPLTGAMNYAEIAAEYLAMKKPDVPVVQTKIRKIIEQIRRAKHVMTGLRDFARQKETLEDDVSVNGLAEEAMTLLEPRLAKENIRLTQKLADNLPTIKGDALRLEQVALNLINNAIDATRSNSDERHIHIQTGLCKQGLMVKVSDNGKGLAKTDIERLFDPFYTTKANDGGSGLGLAICQRIVKEHGGAIIAEGEPGLGAVFTVYLPSHSDEVS